MAVYTLFAFAASWAAAAVAAFGLRRPVQLQHPHILPLLDFGIAAGLLYYVIPYVEGESLRRRLQRAGPLSLT